MPFQVNRALTAQANMAGLANTGSTYAFTAGTEITFGNPVTQTPSDPQENTNSEVVISAVANSGFTGTKTIRYRRLALGLTHPGAQQLYQITGADTLATIKAAVALAHNLIEAEFTFTGTIPAQGNPANTFTLTSVATSLIYTGTWTVQVIRP